MNKLISELESAGLSELLLKDILSKYEIIEIGMRSKDLMESMVCKALSVEEGIDEELKCSLKLNKSKSVSKKSVSKKSVSKKSVSKSAEEEHLNNLCLEAFNEISTANGVTPIVVEKKVKMSAEEKAFQKALEIAEKAKAKEEAKVQALKAKEEAKKAKEEAKEANTKEAKAALKHEKAAALKAQKAAEKEAKAQEKVAEKEAKVAELKAQKEALKNEKKEALKAQKAQEKEALKNEKKALKNEEKKSEKKEKKVSEKKEKKSEKVVAVVEADEVEEEPDVVKRFEFEGVKYLKSKNTGIIYNMEQDVIGKWNEQTQKIDFNKEEGEEEEEEYDN